MKNRFIITGGSGFIGGHLVELLESLGHDVVIYDLKPPEWFTPKAQWVKGDILDLELLFQSADGTDAIFDCSGVLGSAETFEHMEKTIKVNMLGTLNALDTAKQLNIPIVYLSLKNEWKNPYMISKRAGTELCEMYSKYLDTKVIAIKGLNAYGPRQHWNPVKKMFPRFVMQMRNGETVEFFGDGSQIVDMIYVKDMVEVMWLAYTKQVWGSVFDLGSGRPRTVLSVALDIAVVLTEQHGVKIPEFKHVPMRPGEPDQAIALADTSFMVQKLGFYPKFDWYEGIERSVRWYMSLKNK